MKSTLICGVSVFVLSHLCSFLLAVSFLGGGNFELAVVTREFSIILPWTLGGGMAVGAVSLAPLFAPGSVKLRVCAFLVLQLFGYFVFLGLLARTYPTA